VPQLTLLGSTHPPYRHCVPDTVHAAAHAPQFCGSVFRSTHAPLHTVCPVGHAHTPAVHAPPVGQAVQPPQWSALAMMSTHAPLVPHAPNPGAHVQAPIQQDWSLGQIFPQPPQSCEFPVVSTHELPQSVRVAEQPDAHLLCEHTIPVGHGAPQAPQFLASDVVSTQAPEHVTCPVAHPQDPP
jgi:hypothetical protein